MINVLPLVKSPFLANHFLFSETCLLLVDTISPFSRKRSEILIACESSPPGLFLKSKTNPFKFLLLLNFVILFFTCWLLFSLKEVSLM